jgi:hypothetical protein
MLTKEDNETLSCTGPGTPMGKLFRCYWLPALLTSDLAEPDCTPVRLRILSEDLVAFRDSDGVVRVESVQQSVTIGGVRVEPGDWLRGDGDGLVVIPASRLTEVLLVAMEIHNAEERIRQAVEKGASFRQARVENGYHQLQTKR